MRKSGILMHISSLPSDYGIGTMGKEAYKFVDFFKRPSSRKISISIKYGLPAFVEND
mgnify:CR=1 FL=1